jgi:hypothetical protein
VGAPVQRHARRLGAAWAATLVALCCLPAAASAVTASALTPGTPGWNGIDVSGVADPEAATGNWRVEYDDEPAFADPQATASVPLTGASPVGTRIRGLAPDTTYYARLVVDDGITQVAGPALTFATRADDAPLDLAEALAVDGVQVTGAAWETRPSSGSSIPGGPLSAPLGGFPLAGTRFGLLSTGVADDATLPNGPNDASTALGGLGWGGSFAFDASALRVDLSVPASASCLTIAFRFLTEEFPVVLGATRRDGFIAEIDETTWTTTSTETIAPRNFAFAPGGAPIANDATGAAALTPAGAAGTTYNGGTGLLRASTPVAPGPRSLYLTIFDRGDFLRDSAVLLDRLELTADRGAACPTGAVLASSPRPPEGGPAPPPDPPPAPAPQPVLRRTIVGALVSGTVLVARPGERPRALGPGESIPVGSRVDTRRGRARITAAAGAQGTMSGVFRGGVFTVTQPRGRRVVTDLRLAEDVRLRACRNPRAGVRSRPAAKRKRRPGRRFVWGNAKGRFRTTGNHGASLVRGTRWKLEDSCAGTRLTVREGVVEMRDFTKRRTVLVRPGRSYLARPPAARRR